MMSHCDSVAERVAVGEPLGDLATHVASCVQCTRLVAVTGTLGATRHAVDPGLGFAARMTIGAQHRLAVRRRRRIAVGLAATVAAGVLGVISFTHSSELPIAQPGTAEITKDAPAEPTAQLASEADLKMLVNLADVDRSSHLSARWGHIHKPLRPYRHLLEGIKP